MNLVAGFRQHVAQDIDPLELVEGVNSIAKDGRRGYDPWGMDVRGRTSDSMGT